MQSFPTGAHPTDSNRRTAWFLVLAAMLVPLAFAAFTGHVWEDYYITLRSSRNLVEGHGLVFQPGERVHTFTSPLGVLLPALCLAISGGRDEIALWLFRAVNAGLLAAAAALLWQTLTRLALGRTGRFVACGLILLDPKLADFASNGQETALLVFFALLLWSELERTPSRPLPLGLAYAGLMWTRPDAFILGAALTLPHLVFSPEAAPARRRLLGRFVAAAGLGLLLYLPWLLWTTWYYGSPVPHTIIAKAAMTPPLHFTDWVLIPARALVRRSMLDYLYLPANFLFGGWPIALTYAAHGLTVVAAFAWIWRKLPAAGRRASLTVFIGMFYLCAILLYSWYVPPWSAIAAIALGFAADSAGRAPAIAARRSLRLIARGLALAAVAFQGTQFLAVAWQMRIQQRLIERNGRQAIGLWLRHEAAPDDTVFLEPLGYIGYFSRLKMYDFPGLSSPEVSSLVRQGHRHYYDVVRKLQPTWLVLRPNELVRQGFAEDGRIPGYRLVREWNAATELDAIGVVPGRSWLEYDARFLVYHRTH